MAVPNRWELITKGRVREPKDPEVNDWEYGPTSLPEAVEFVIGQFTTDDIAMMTSYQEDKLGLLHHTLGQQIRNEFGLWKGNTMLLESCGRKHPDDASMVIIQTIWHVLRSRMVHG